MVKKIAIITGGSRGIGAATAELAAKAGFDVMPRRIATRKIFCVSFILGSFADGLFC